MIGSNSKSTKRYNRAIILKIVQQNKMITRAQIAKQTGLTRAAITAITASLIDDGLLREVRDHKINIKTVPLEINTARHRIISLSLERYAIRAVLVDVGGNILYHKEISYIMGELENNEINNLILQIVTNILKTCQLDPTIVLGIGIAGPGPINQQNRGMSHSDTVSEKPPYQWNPDPIKAILKNRVNLPVYLENDCNISALGERWYGAGRGVKNFAVYTIGLGIGAGVVLDGQMQLGKGDVFSEIGHITIDMNGPECSCGNRGCLEIYGSFRYLVKRYYKTMGFSNTEEDDTDLSYIRNVESIFKKANAGHSVCLNLVKEHAEILGIGAVSLSNMFSPDKIIITSNEIGDTDFHCLVPLIRDVVRKRSFRVIGHDLEVMASALGNDGVLYGAAALVLENFLSRELQ